MNHAERILWVLHDFAGGGSERIAIRLANRWAGLGRRVTILCGDGEGPSRALVAPEVSVRVVAPAIRRGPWSRILLGRAAARVVPELAPDVIVGPGNFHIPVLWALRMAGGRGTPPIVCKLSNPLTRPGRGAIGQFIFSRRLRVQARSLAALVALSPVLAREASRELAHPQIRWLANPNLADDWEPRPPHDRTGIILCAGRLTRQKNFALALRTFALIGQQYRLIIAGEGEERAGLEVLAAELGLTDRIEMPGFVPDIAPYLARADALLVSARYEGYPGVIVEALGAAVPVVTTRCAAALQDIMVDPSFGEVVDPRPQALADAVERVAAGARPDPDAVHRLLDPRRTTASATAWLELLDEIVDAQQRQ